ncbi:MAG: hypothetical protein ACOC53_06110, partial [Candidatus Saliniplasma sp.]
FCTDLWFYGQVHLGFLLVYLGKLLAFTTILTALQNLIYLDSFCMSASLSKCWLPGLDVRQPALGCTYLLLYLKILIKLFSSTRKVFYKAI